MSHLCRAVAAPESLLCGQLPRSWWDQLHPRSEGAGRSGSMREKPLPQAGEGGLPLGRCITGQVCLESRLGNAGNLQSRLQSTNQQVRAALLVHPHSSSRAGSLGVTLRVSSHLSWTFSCDKQPLLNLSCYLRPRRVYIRDWAMCACIAPQPRGTARPTSRGASGRGGLRFPAWGPVPQRSCPF